MSRHHLLALLIPLVAACTPGVMRGTVDGETLVVRSATLLEWDHPSFTPSRWLILSDAPNLCAHYSSNGYYPSNSTNLVIRIMHEDDDRRSVEPDAGNYRIRGLSNRTADASFLMLDSECNDLALGTGRNATKGSVSISSIELGEGGHARGTFELTFGPKEDEVTGSFNAVFCRTERVLLWNDVECV